MGNKLHKDKKEIHFNNNYCNKDIHFNNNSDKIENHFCNKDIHFNNNDTYKCGSNQISTKHDNNSNFYYYKYQCDECENKESKEKEIFFIKNYLLKKKKLIIMI
jgi:hypothetical protein